MNLQIAGTTVTNPGPRCSNHYFTEPLTTESSGLMEEEQGHTSVLEVFKMLGRCIKETFPEYLPPIPILNMRGKKRKYDSAVGPLSENTNTTEWLSMVMTRQTKPTQSGWLGYPFGVLG